MAKKIVIEHDGTKYTLEFTRNTIRQMEVKGFRIDELSTMPMTRMPQLFAGAFLANHKFLKQSVIDEIFESVNHKDQLFEALGTMYGEVLAAMMGTDEESQGNANWTMA